MEPIWALGCTGEFGCDCPSKLAEFKGHGTRVKYQKGCRCIRCTKANSNYTRKYREQRGTARAR